MSSDRQADIATFRPSDRLGFLLKHAHRRLNAAVTLALEPYDLDARELVTMTALAVGQPASQQDVARALGIDRTSMVALVDSLERKALLARQPDPTDRRRNLLALTGSGSKTLVAASAAAAEAEREVLRSLGPRQEQQLRSALRLLADVD